MRRGFACGHALGGAPESILAFGYGVDQFAAGAVVSVATPAYGSRITSPVTVEGHVTGVDEGIDVHVQQLHSNGCTGRCRVAARGESTPWHTTVPSDH